MSLYLGLATLAMIGALAHWKPNPVPFIISAIISYFVGLYWFDTFPTSLGLAISLGLLVYWLYCLGMTFRLIFWSEQD